MKSRSSLIIFLFLYLNLFAGEDVRIISSSQSSLVFEYSPNFNPIHYSEINGTKFTEISFNNAAGFSEEKLGKIQLPYRVIPVGVQSEFGNTIQVLTTQHTIVKGKIAPSYGDNLPTYNQIQKANLDFQNNELVQFGNFGISRDLQIQPILISPIQYNAELEEIKIYNKITVRVNFKSTKSPQSEIVDKYVNKNIINFNVAKYWGKERKTLRKSVTNSVLSEGTWYRFEAPEEGIYKISQSELNSLGISAGSVDPRTIKIFNNGGKALSERINSNTPTDLIENAIMVKGEDDGSFDANDEIIFYGRGTDFWEFDTGANKFLRRHHPYSNKNYYWITSGGTTGKRISGKSYTGEVEQTQTETKAFVAYEEDKLNIGRTGRDYWGDDFSQNTNTRTYINDLSGRVSTEPIKYLMRFCNAGDPSLPLRIYENNTQIYSGALSGINGADYVLGRDRNIAAQFNSTLPENRSALKITITASSPDAKAYLDYYEIEYVRSLNPEDDEIVFYANDNRSEIEYSLTFTRANDVTIFDVTDNANVMTVSNPNISGGYVSFRANEDSDGHTKYIALTPSKYKSIDNIEKMDNSNIHGYTGGVEYIIISDKKFEDQANRLAQYRSNDSPNILTTRVFYMDEILNEFSGGTLDPTAIRNFLKWSYENWDVKPFYVHLFGDGDYDYFDTEGYDQNFIPTFQTPESLFEIGSYPFDDYYTRIVGSDNDESADLAIGRSTIQTVEDARIVVDKIIAYESVENGLWKNLITTVADDGLTSNGNDGALHTRQSETLIKDYVPQFMDVKKIYLAAYPTVQTGFGRRKPEVNEAIITAVNQGTLILNYVGHGSPKLWAHEHVFTQTGTIPSIKNEDYFFLTAATCDFGLFDDPTYSSSVEDMYMLEEGGLIGSFSAARVVYARQNEQINQEFYKNLLGGNLQDMINTTLGEAFYKTKTIRTSANDEKYHLIGDPAIRLNLPKIPASIESVNGNDLTIPVRLSALSKVTTDGIVRNYDGSIDPSFNGEAIVTVYDSERLKPLPELGFNYHMVEPGGVIFRGRASVTDGKFDANFTVPKDISYEDSTGKIVVYLDDEETDGVGFTDQIRIGGTDTTAIDDGEGPEIEIYYDESESSNSYLVNEDFTLVVNLADETGLNTTGTGIGHKLQGVIDDEESKAIDFTNYFVGDLDAAGKSGQVTYKVTGATLGEHKIDVTAWDVFNNPSKQTSYFTVVNSDEVVLKDVVNYPNPFSSNTTFLFQHNITSPIDVKIKIFTVSGRLIKVIEDYSISDKFVKIDWDGRDQDGSQIANGTYLYKVIVKSLDGSTNQNVLGKLAVYR